MKRLAYAYAIGLTTCLVSVLLANRHQGGRFTLLFAALLGISSGVAQFVGSRMVDVSMTVASALLSALFVFAEALRSRSCWLRWLGYGLWALLALASLVSFSPPKI